MKKIKINWGQYGKDLNTLTNKIKKVKDNFDGVYGIPMGGVMVAMYISNKLGIPLLLKPTLNTLIVDDISDTGLTLSHFTNHIRATLYKTPWTNVIPEISVRVIKQRKKDWVVFPYE